MIWILLSVGCHPSVGVAETAGEPLEEPEVDSSLDSPGDTAEETAAETATETAAGSDSDSGSGCGFDSGSDTDEPGPIPGRNLDGDEPRIVGEWELAQVGSNVSGDADADGDGAPDILVVGVGEDSGELGAWLYFGPVAGMQGVLDAPASFGGGERWACSFYPCPGTFAGDLNGDGLADVLLGLPGDAGYLGAAYVMLAPFSGERDVADADATLLGEEDFDYAGYAVAAAGNTDGDAFADILVGAPGDITGWTYLLNGPLSGTWSLPDAPVAFRGTATEGGAGTIVASAGDRNGDGLDDVLIGTNGHAGTVFLVNGPFDGIVDLWDADASVELPYLTSAANAGDVDADGLPDLVVGDASKDGSGWGDGYVCLFVGALSGTVGAAAATATLKGDSLYEHVGESVHTAGDVDADGFGDVIVSAFYEGYHTDGIEAALGYVVHGPVGGTMDLNDIPSRFTASGGGMSFHAALAGDIDCDGRQDLLLGDMWQDESERAAGAVWPILAKDVP